MSIQTIPAFLYMQQHTVWADDYSSQREEWRPDVWTYKFSEDQPDRIYVRDITLTVDVPDDFDPVPRQVAALQAKREEIIAKFSAELKANADKLQKLLAITNGVVA